MASGSRPNAAPIKIICVGLGRTGTTSLSAALEMLGFRPCHHLLTKLPERGSDLATWSSIGDGNSAPEVFDSLFRRYVSITDYPAAMHAKELYAAYPDAKYILTTRDPAKWEKSINATILRGAEAIRACPNRTQVGEDMLAWGEKYLRGYHHGRLSTHAQSELLDHNVRIEELIPPEKLLVYEVGEGWDRLVAFLGVIKPRDPFPHMNDTKQFQAHLKVFGVSNMPEET